MLAVAASLALPIALIILASISPGSPEESDADIRGVIGALTMLPLFAVFLAAYHGLISVAALFVPIGKLLLVAILPFIGSVTSAAAIMATGAPLTWDRMGDMVVFAAVLWVPIAVGALVHYFVSFKPRSTGTTI
jgi:hypothetical protein